MPDLYGPDPEPYEGDFWDGYDEANAEPDDDEPVMFGAVCDGEVPIEADECPRCGSRHFE
jgi:hypothetical protein